ncbi:FtsX-like permease family protein [Paenibacillus pini]|uniref:ABC transporter permease protein YvcS n=1 Tax=Paenibacillus pini JCM 16418 TaxID=1236976 RepID=W7YSW8_9BACL|nr:ABC transporter permease [Paenibacillus pini]GAF07726.1 ABC transporter permease protein YvcS [Paenibacillus pini JCM 16418]
MSFPQFAFNNVKRNARAYFAYFLSSSFMVMVFFTYALFIFHPDINNTDLGSNTRMVMEIMEYIIYIFSFLFVLYSIGSFLKARNKEFGILTILGATQGQMSGLVFVENMIIGAVSIVTGIASGLVLSKLFLMLSSEVIGIDNLGLYFPVKALLLTVSAFAVLFVVISAFTLILIRRNRVLELIKGTSKPKTEPKASILISVFGIILLGIGYYYLNKKIEIAALTGIAGTYFFFTQITVVMMRLLKRSRALVWRGTNLIWISEMAYKMKDNARILFMVTVVTSISCMAVAFVLSADQRNKTEYSSNPYAIQYHIYDEQSMAKDLQEVDNILKKNKVPYETMKTEAYVSPIQGADKSYVYVMSLSNYNMLAQALKVPTMAQLANHQSVVVVSPMSEEPVSNWYNQDVLRLKKPDEKFEIKQVLYPDQNISPMGNDFTLIVSNDEYTKLKKSISEDEASRIEHMIVYHIPEWNHKKALDKDDQEYLIGTDLHQQAFEKISMVK